MCGADAVLPFTATRLRKPFPLQVKIWNSQHFVWNTNQYNLVHSSHKVLFGVRCQWTISEFKFCKSYGTINTITYKHCLLANLSPIIRIGRFLYNILRNLKKSIYETSVPVGSANRLPLAAPLLVDTAQVWPGERGDVAKPPLSMMTR